MFSFPGTSTIALTLRTAIAALAFPRYPAASPTRRHAKRRSLRAHISRACLSSPSLSVGQALSRQHWRSLSSSPAPSAKLGAKKSARKYILAPNLAPPAGLEPATRWLTATCSQCCYSPVLAAGPVISAGLSCFIRGLYQEFGLSLSVRSTDRFRRLVSYAFPQDGNCALSPKPLGFQVNQTEFKVGKYLLPPSPAAEFQADMLRRINSAYDLCSLVLHTSWPH